MAIMLKNGHKHLIKYWWSFYKKNNQPIQLIIDGMYKRILSFPEYNGAVNKVIFYDNHTNIEVDSKPPLN